MCITTEPKPIINYTDRLSQTFQLAEDPALRKPKTPISKAHVNLYHHRSMNGDIHSIKKMDHKKVTILPNITFMNLSTTNRAQIVRTKLDYNSHN
jgi:hypothetical protein